MAKMCENTYWKPNPNIQYYRQVLQRLILGLTDVSCGIQKVATYLTLQVYHQENNTHSPESLPTPACTIQIE